MDVIASNAADTQEMAMTEILATGEERKRPYSSSDMAFQFNDVEIRNPYFSPCGTAVVDPVLAYGFDVFHTGGGCMALRKKGRSTCCLQSKWAPNVPSSRYLDARTGNLIGST